MANLIIYDPTKLPTSTDLNIDATNNDAGATYNSALLDGPVSLLAYNPTPEVDSLMELPSNISNYSFVDPVSTPNAIPNMMSDWNIGLGGDVSNGWNIGFNSDGSWDLTTSGKNIDSWANPPELTQSYNIRVPDSQLSLDGLPGFTASDYATIVQSATTIPDAFVGYEGTGGNVISYPASSEHYQVAVPEAGLTGLLIGGAALAIAAKRKGKSLVDKLRK